jgi:hypothetical protein
VPYGSGRRNRAGNIDGRGPAAQVPEVVLLVEDDQLLPDAVEAVVLVVQGATVHALGASPGGGPSGRGQGLFLWQRAARSPYKSFATV